MSPFMTANGRLPTVFSRHRVLLTLVSLAIAVVVGLIWRMPKQSAGELRRQLPQVDVSRLTPRAAKLITHAKTAVERSPKSGECWGQLGNTLWAHEMMAEAAVCYAQAELLSPRDVRWPYLRGLCLERQDLEDSLECMRRAASLDHISAIPNVQLAEMLLDRGELQEAKHYLTRARAVSPGDSRVLLAWGRLAFMSGDINEALRWTSKAAEIDPARRRIRVLLCQILQRRGDNDAANEQLRVIDSLPPVAPYYEWPDPLLAEAAKLKNDSIQLTLRAQQLIESGNPQQAVVLLDELGGRNARDVQVVTLLGKAYARLGDLARAHESLLSARDLDPNQAPVHFELGNLARLTGRHAEAVEHYREAVRLEPDYAIAYYYLSASQVESGDEQGAITALQQASRCVPDNLRVQRELIALLWRFGHREEAMEQLEKTLRFAPNDAETRLLLDRLQSSGSKSRPTNNALDSQNLRDPS